MPVTEQNWHNTRHALAHAADRFLTLAAASGPHAMATADWTVLDTVTHVAALASMNTHLVRSTESPVHEQMLATTVDTLPVFNAAAVTRSAWTDLPPVAAALRADVEAMLASTAAADPTTPVVWIGGARLPLCGLLAHLTNEFNLHGYDIARRTRSPWTIPVQDTGLFFETFLVEAVRLGPGHLFDGGAPPDERRITVGFRSRHTTPVSIVLHRGRASLTDWTAPADVRVDFDPTVLTLMMFHRISMARAALTAGLRIWGPRPWRLPTFMATLRAP